MTDDSSHAAFPGIGRTVCLFSAAISFFSISAYQIMLLSEYTAPSVSLKVVLPPVTAAHGHTPLFSSDIAHKRYTSPHCPLSSLVHSGRTDLFPDFPKGSLSSVPAQVFPSGCLSPAPHSAFLPPHTVTLYPRRSPLPAEVSCTGAPDAHRSLLPDLLPQSHPCK